MHEIIRMQFSSRTLKIVTTFLDRGSVTKKNMKMKKFTGAMLYQLSYEATGVGSRLIVGSYVPVKEMSVNDI